MIQVPVTWDRANRRKDRSVSMAFTTNLEISNNDFAEMDKLVGQEGWCLFSPNELEPMNVPKENAPSEGKSQATLTRNTLYVAWELLTDKSIPFDMYYNQQLEKYRQFIKSKLPERN